MKTQATVAAPTKAEAVQINGGQKTPKRNATETGKAKAEITATKENLAAQPAPVATLPQSQIAAANNVQPSLF